jgi:transglutaminase-like putative cysteine protease
MRWTERNLRTHEEQRKAAWAWVVQHTGDPLLVEFLAKLIQVCGVPARDEVALAECVLAVAQDKVKYFKEQPERWQSPVRTLALRIGDCDDKTFLIASSLRTFRVPVRLKFLRITLPKGTVVREPGGTTRPITKERRVSHIYPQALLRGKPTSLEAVKSYPLGFDSEMLAQRKGIPYTVETIGDF